MKQLDLLYPNLPGPFKDRNGNEYYGTPAKNMRGLVKFRYGVGGVEVNYKGFVRVWYHGNMGSRLLDVEETVDNIFGNGAWAELYGNKTYESGSPDYSYSLEGVLDPEKWLRK